MRTDGPTCAPSAILPAEMKPKLSLPLASRAEIEALERIAREARLHPSIRQIVAFGSRVRGDFRGDSDLDILIILREIEARDGVIAFLCKVEADLDVSLSPVVYTVSEFERNRQLGGRFVRNVEREGVVLYDDERL